MHIPKTAGTSVRNSLELSLKDKLYPTNKDLNDNFNRWYDSPEALLKRNVYDKLILTGHYNLNYINTHFSMYNKITIFRHPYNRALSHLNMHHNHISKTTIDKLLNSDDFMNANIKNLQCKMLLDDIQYNASSTQVVNNLKVEDAKLKLNDFAFFGITENIKRFYQHLEDELQFKIKNKQVVHNKSESVLKLTNTQKKTLEQNLELDFILFDLIKNMIN